MRIYRWKKPEVVITKGNDGSLSPGTYYVWGYFGIYLYAPDPPYFLCATSPRPEVQTVVLSAGETSITASLKVTGTITSITDYGSGKIKITSALHCLDAGNTITISGTTNYNGTYTVADWIDYNNFTVVKTYVADESSGTWECSTRHNGANRLLIYILNQNPFDANGDYVVTSQGGNHLFYVNGDSLKITSYTYTTNGYLNVAADCTKLTLDARWIIQKGLPYLYGTETSITEAQLQSEFESSGLNDVCEASSFLLDVPKIKWQIPIHLYLPNLERTISNGDIGFGGMAYLPKVTFELCIIYKIGYSKTLRYNSGIKAGWLFKLRKSVLDRTWSALDNAYNITDVTDSVVLLGHPISNVQYLSTAYFVWSAIWSIGSTVTISNIKIFNDSNLCDYGWGRDCVAFKNVEFQSIGSFDFKTYVFNDASSDFVNIDTVRENNEKVVVKYTRESGNKHYYFWRQKTIYVYDEFGEPIENAKLTIRQGSNEYVFYSDENGIVETGDTTLLEQESVGITGSYNYTNTLYLDWSIEIEKTGKETYKAVYTLPKDIEEYIVLKTEVFKISSLSFTHPTKALNNGTINIGVTGGTQPYQYSIDGGETWEESGVFTGLSEGDYVVQVKDAEDNLIEGLTVTLKAPQLYSDLLSGSIETIELTGEISVIELSGSIDVE